MVLVQKNIVRTLGMVLLAATVACEEDTLAPVSGYMPTDCNDPGNCSTGGVRLDAGTLSTDSGVVLDAGEPDTGDLLDMGEPDLGPQDVGTPDFGPPDLGPPDLGPPDLGPPPSQFLDLNGTWQTSYNFDISNYLLGISELADITDFLNQTFLGNFSTGIGFLDSLVQGLVNQYIPPEVQQAVSILNSIANFFEQVEATGVMSIVQDPPLVPSDPTTALHGTENWTTLTVFIINNCPLGRMDPTYPQCARFTFPVAANPQTAGPLEIGVQADPFDGTLDAGTPEADFILVDREVELEMRKFILLVIDTLVRVSSGGTFQNFRQLVGSWIDCVGLGQAAGSVLVEAACVVALDALVQQVGNIGIDWEAMDFDQSGHAIDRTPQDGLNRPEELQTMTNPDTIDGNFRFLISDPMGGTWSGVP